MSARVVLANTSVAGLTSATATLMNKYGRPQMTDIAAKSIHACVDILSL